MWAANYVGPTFLIYLLLISLANQVVKCGLEQHFIGNVRIPEVPLLLLLLIHKLTIVISFLYLVRNCKPY